MNEDETFIEFPVTSAMIAITAYIITGGIYWVIDGFRKEEKE